MIPIGSATKVFKILETPQTLPLAKVWTGDDQKPHPLKQVVPKYPEDARENPQTTPPTEVSTEYDEKPRVLRKVHPKYPATARRAEKEGLVTLEFTVEVDGKVADIKVVRSMIGFGFDEAAIEAVKKWHFTPAKKGGEAVPIRVRLPIRFTLEQ
jgi:protein TonB